MQRVRLPLLAVAALSFWLAPVARPARAAEPLLKAGDYVAVIGDSITEQRMYSAFVEDYLLACQPAPNLRATQFGWGGETAPGFASRMANDVLRFGPVVATTCFGMNDGGYSPMDPAKAKRYQDGQVSIVEQLKKAGVRAVVVGSPGCVDFNTFRNSPEQAAMYNKTLGEMRDIARRVAAGQGVAFADVYTPMIEATTKGKAKYGPKYHVAGGDGFHPDANGHLVMAYAFLKALGCDGDLGKITIDLAANKADAAGGHKVLSAGGGAVELESTRYPFCFYGADKSQPGSTLGAAELVPFNEDLNRLTLVVTGAGDGKVKVTWGDAAKEFAAADLAKGVNLAAAFAEGNPFSEPFRKVHDAVSQQQAMEVALVKQLVHTLPSYAALLPEEKETLERLAAALVKKDQAARDASAAAVVPVRHTIRVEAVK